MTFTRRSVLGGLVGGAAATGLGVTGAQSASARPALANAFGFTRLVFSDDFSSLKTFDLDKTGAPGFKWYTVAPWDKTSAKPGDFAIHREGDNSFLRLTPSSNNMNWQFSTMDPKTGNGAAFEYGYVEARMRFRTPPEPDWASNNYPCSWPSFWSISSDHLRGTPGSHTVELDILEACNGEGKYVGVLHDMRKGARWSARNGQHQISVKTTEWHTYGAGWTKGGVAWFFDDKEVGRQSWGPSGPSPKPLLNYEPVASTPKDCFSLLDEVKLVFGIGSGVGNPIDVDWVKIWQK